MLPGSEDHATQVQRHQRRVLGPDRAGREVALGADRFAEYERATDYNYRQTSQLVARLELPPAAADG